MREEKKQEARRYRLNVARFDEALERFLTLLREGTIETAARHPMPPHDDRPDTEDGITGFLLALQRDGIRKTLEHVPADRVDGHLSELIWIIRCLNLRRELISRADALEMDLEDAAAE